MNSVLSQLLSAMASVHATDMHLVPGQAPFLRVDGTLARASTVAPLDAPSLAALIELSSGRTLAEGTTSFEYSFEQPGIARFRGHAFRQATGWGLSIRLVPLGIPTLQQLRLPPVVKVLAECEPGLVLVTGPTGSGKSSTVAAMLQFMVERRLLHIITVEDPIEYRLSDLPACVSQREVGRDTDSYRAALQDAVREDPDVIFVGEIRDTESLEVALQAAESGHCVISTFHTASALKTLQRIIGMYRPEDQTGVRLRLTEALRGIISQRLLQRRGRSGRVVCTELLVNNYAVKECLRDPARLATLPGVLERSSDQQMHTFDQNLSVLVRDGHVALETAVTYAASPAELRRNLTLAGVA